MSESTTKFVVTVVFVALFGVAIAANIIGLAILFGIITVLGLVAMALTALAEGFDRAKLKAAREAGRAVGRYQRAQQERPTYPEPRSLISE